MNHREPPQVPQGMRRGIQFMAILLVAVMTGMVLVSARAGVLIIRTKPEAQITAIGYLPTRGAPPLRFAEIIVPASPSAQLAVVSPASPASTSTTGIVGRASDVTLPVTSASHSSSSTQTASASSSSEKSGPLSILPDEMRPQVRPEDFLPFFRIPGTGRNPDVILAVPVPSGPPASAPQAPSSATYLQTDK